MTVLQNVIANPKRWHCMGAGEGRCSRPVDAGGTNTNAAGPLPSRPIDPFPFLRLSPAFTPPILRLYSACRRGGLQGLQIRRRRVYNMEKRGFLVPYASNLPGRCSRAGHRVGQFCRFSMRLLKMAVRMKGVCRKYRINTVVFQS